MARTYTLRGTPDAGRSRLLGDEQLNPQQQTVVDAPAGPLLVIAGAGTGKTHTVTCRVVRLIERGVAPERILLLTFTNRAAREMLSRVERLLGDRAHAVWGGTFHSCARRILRMHGPAVGLPTNFTILDGEDAAGVVRDSLKGVALRHPDVRFPRPETLLGLFSAATNTERPVEDLLLERMPQFHVHADDIVDLRDRYRARKRALGVVDFDDLLVYWARLLDHHPDVRDNLQRRFDHVLVDEYQDTNRLQARIVDSMAAQHRNLMVVGDDAQAIYAFRGADYANILGFEDRYPDATRHLLEINYRSTPEVLALANRSIRNNTAQFPKQLESRQPAGPLPALIECVDEDQQAAFIGQRVLELRDEGITLGRIAVLYRAHRHSMELQLELSRRGIPYVVRSGMRFFEQRHIKDILAFLRWVENPRDYLSFRRVVTLVDGIGPVTAERLFQHLEQGADPAAALRDSRHLRVVPGRARRSWEPVRDLLVHLAGESLRGDAAASLDLVRDSFYDGWGRQAFDSWNHRSIELDTLAEYAAQYGPVHAFLDSLALAGVLGGEDARPGESADEMLVLSSIHQAKGLEFNAVFVIWLAEDRFPSARAASDQREMEEERRLFHVAVTRAQRDLYLTRPMIGWERERGRVVLRPSPFLRELVVPGEPPVWERWTLAPEAAP